MLETTIEKERCGSGINEQIRVLQKAILDKYENTRITTYPACRSIIQQHLDKGGLQYVLERLGVMPLALDSHSLPINALQKYCDNPDWGNGNKPVSLPASQREKDFKDGKFQWGLARASTDKGAVLAILRSIKKHYDNYGKDFADYLGVHLDSFTRCLQEAESEVYGEGADTGARTLDILLNKHDKVVKDGV
jgi:hypothetical protein